MKKLSIIVAGIIVLALMINTTVTNAQTTTTVEITDSVKWGDIDPAVQTELMNWKKTHAPGAPVSLTDVASVTYQIITDFPIGTTDKVKREIWITQTNSAGEEKNILFRTDPISETADADGNITSINGKSGDSKGMPVRDRK